MSKSSGTLPPLGTAAIAAGPPLPDNRLFTTPFVLCSAANLLQGLAFNLYLHLPGFLRQLGAGEVQIGVIFGVAAAAAIAARPAIGRAMDTQGRRVVILAGGIVHTVVCALYLCVGTLGPSVCLIRAAHGLAEAALFGAFFTYAADLIPPSRRTEGIALFGVSGMLPISLGGLLGDAILSRADYAALFRASVALAAASFALSLRLRDRALTASDLPNRGFFATFAQDDLLPVWFLGAVFTTALAAYFTFLKTYVMETGNGSVGSFFTVYAAAAIILRLLFSRLPERIGVKRVLFPALGLLAVGILLLASAASGPEIVAAGVACGLGHGFIFPILSGLVVARARPAERGAALSIFTALSDAGVLIGGPLLGAVIHVAGYAGMFTTAAALVVSGALVFAAWDSGR